MAIGEFRVLVQLQSHVCFYKIKFPFFVWDNQLVVELVRFPFKIRSDFLFLK
jgi:hypothetical protein